jgi:hypothetical protein
MPCCYRIVFIRATIGSRYITLILTVKKSKIKITSSVIRPTTFNTKRDEICSARIYHLPYDIFSPKKQHDYTPSSMNRSITFRNNIFISLISLYTNEKKNEYLTEKLSLSIIVSTLSLNLTVFVT